MYYGDYKRSPKELNEYFGGKGEPSIAKGGVLKPFDNTIQPKDGNWTITASKPVLKNCPAGLEKQMDNLVLPKSGNKVFKKPFDGTEILPAGTKWLTLSPNVYRGLILTETQPTFKSIYDLKVITPSLMEGNLNVFVQIPGQKTCEVKIDFSYKN
ncbi:MAG: hypothetical protein R2822_05030 [Spirosomataceae bacterium]